QQIERAEEQLYSLADKGEIENGPKAFKNILTSTVAIIDAAVSRDGEYTGIPSGFTDLDKKLGGLNRSDLIILAARPAMGKTALVTNMAFNAAQKAGGKIAFFSLEMASEQLATRMLSEQTGISSEVIRKGEINKDQFGTIYNVARELETLDFFIDDTPALPVAALRTRARRLKRQYGGLDLIVVDYLQLMQGRSGGSENRVQEISEITRGLKGIATELDVPVIALSQLSRQVENRDDKRPQLADLRESGSIEQDADVVLFIYREAYYEQNKMPIKKGEEDESTFASRMDAWQNHMETIHNQASVIISKNRHGPTGDVTLYFDGSTTKFSDYVPDDR
ncbi:MAG: replicative DNA helicase, partial [Pseudomonadota bacterium]|nr:replicative DNA helicase [Pseudomonadota bacterium]